ncbi:MAG: patatin-like phospholipase family protein [Synergistaceae bacterium]|jgi:NTE family protein|nr:patatin-like phospholipase family protein [Synergistaceae bacterium]
MFFLFAFAAPFRAEAGVVLALSGGGTRGFAHVGVIEALDEAGVPIVGIVGTSIGSLIGALKACGYDSKQIRAIVTELDLPALLTENAGSVPLPSGSFKMNTISALTYKKSNAGGAAGPMGILTGDKLFRYYARLTRHVYTDDFNDLPIPFAAVAADVRTGEKVVLRSGSLPSAMRASMSIPVLFEPWEINGHLLVDGGIVSNLPVDTAKEIFPGHPVIAVDVSDIPSQSRPINSFIDVVDQSLTIVMRKHTEEEAQHADVLLVPDVREFPFLDASVAEAVIGRGREAAEARMDDIKRLSAHDAQPLRHEPRSAPTPVVSDVEVLGLTPAVASKVRKGFMRWVGKPFDADEVTEEVERIARTMDVAGADYSFRRDNRDSGVLVVNVKPNATFEAGISGYATNLDPYRWLYLKGTWRGAASKNDSLRWMLRAGEQWEVGLSYLTAAEAVNSWEILFDMQKWELDSNMGNRNWERGSLGARYLFRAGVLDMGVGAAAERINGVDDAYSFGPTFFVARNTLDSTSDPRDGVAWRLNAWWPDGEELLYRFTYFRPVSAGHMWRTYLRIGYVEGGEKDGHAAYLGAAEELYSIADRPIEAERTAWVNLTFRRVLRRSFLGIVAAEAFAGYGYAMDASYAKIASPWEVGVAFTVPNDIVNLRLAAMYGSEEFRFGFFIGVPIWEHYPLP